MPGESADHVIDDLRKAVQGLDLRSKVDVRWAERPTPYPPPYETQKVPLVRLFLQTVRDQRDGQLETAFGESAGDYNHLASRIPTLVYGPAGGDYHLPSEWVDSGSVVRVRDLYLRFLASIREHAGRLAAT